MWIYGSGFPKSMNIGIAIDKRNGVESKVVGTGKSGSGDTHTRTMKNKLLSGDYSFGGEYEIKEAQNEWNGWGSCLKPSFEPIIVARKPFKGSLIDNVIKYGVGGINIDECRVGNERIEYYPTNLTEAHGNKFGNGAYMPKDTSKEPISHEGRFPSNTILTYDETDFDEVCGGFPNTKSNGGKQTTRNFTDYNGGSCNSYMNISNRKIDTGRIDTGYVAPCDSGSASRYFYCAKASKKDRDEGLDEFENISGANITGRKEGSAGLVIEDGEQNPFAGKASPNNKNIHPTVKPTSLMQYLVRLVTPKGGIILDPFMGSGSTGKAVMFENKERNSNYSFIGIEKEKEYCDIARSRIEWAKSYKDEKQDKNQVQINEFGELF